jgi:hypothetical protein
MNLRDTFDDLAVDLNLTEDRSGRFARSLARRRQWRLIKDIWPRLLVVFLVGASLTGLTVLLPLWSRGFVAGAWLASVVWFLVLTVIQTSGTAPTMMGALAEQWTHQELRRVRPGGWKIISHLTPTQGDIDHVAVGPGGLIVFETKWTSSERFTRSITNVSEDCVKTQEKARLLRLALKNRLGDAPTRSVVVYWGPQVSVNGDEYSPRECDGVTVLVGSELRRWLNETCDQLQGPMGKDDIQSAWLTLLDLAHRTDQRELGNKSINRNAPLRRSTELALGVIATLGVFWSLGLGFRWLGVSCLPAALVIGGTSGLVYRNSQSHPLWRLIAFSVAAGCSLFLLLITGLYVYFSLLHG